MADVAPRFGIGVKLNPADFQRGGFEPQHAVMVVRGLNARTRTAVQHETDVRRHACTRAAHFRLRLYAFRCVE
jgi:2,4-dienoyl-CoA reductase-like NADH-dependent reductase (Old Yellow Enzyme family)